MYAYLSGIHNIETMAVAPDPYRAKCWISLYLSISVAFNELLLKSMQMLSLMPVFSSRVHEYTHLRKPWVQRPPPVARSLINLDSFHQQPQDGSS